MLAPWRKAVGISALLAVSAKGEPFDVEQALRNTATHINQMAPRPIGNNAYLDGAEAYERTLKYRFSFKHLTKEELSSAFTLKQTEFLNDFVCSTPEMKVFVDHGVTLKYAYYDKHRKLVVIITVDTRTCGSK
jgi:hypothetical protein